MVYIFIAVLIVLVFLAAAGQTLALLLRYDARNPFLYPFLGSFVLGAVALYISFYMPISGPLSFLILSIAVPGLIVLFRKIRAFVAIEEWQSLAFMALGFSGLVGVYVFAAAWSVWPGFAYDTDLYHFQSLRWLNEYGAVTGLGNLHSRLGHASSWLALAAIFNHGLLEGRVAWVMPPLMLICFSAYLVWEGWRGRHPWIRVYAMGLLPLSVYHMIHWGSPNLYQDFPSLILVAIVGCEILYFIFDKEFSHSKQASIICLCLAQSFLIKSLPVVSIVIIPALMVYILFFQEREKFVLIIMIFAFPVCAAFLWLAWHVIATGYPFFPITIFPFKVDWLMSHDVVAGHTLAIRGWARMPGPEYKNAFAQGITYWFFPWLENLFQSRNLNGVFMACPLLVGSVLWLAVCRRLRGVGDISLLLWPLACICYWFWLAPDPRFGMEYMWLFFALGASSVVRHLPELWFKIFRRYTERKFFMAYLVSILLLCFIGAVGRHRGHIAWVWPGHAVARSVEKREIHFPGQAAFEIYVPMGSDDRCGDAQLPCTPYVHDLLETRTQGDLSAGFRLRKE